jgi:hypothetical protein
MAGGAGPVCGARGAGAVSRAGRANTHSNGPGAFPREFWRIVATSVAMAGFLLIFYAGKVNLKH